MLSRLRRQWASEGDTGAPSHELQGIIRLDRTAVRGMQLGSRRE